MYIRVRSHVIRRPILFPSHSSALGYAGQHGHPFSALHRTRGARLARSGQPSRAGMPQVSQGGAQWLLHEARGGGTDRKTGYRHLATDLTTPTVQMCTILHLAICFAFFQARHQWCVDTGTPGYAATSTPWPITRGRRLPTTGKCGGAKMLPSPRTPASA